jgi:integrase
MADRVGAELERQFRRSRYQGDDDLVFGHRDTGHPYDASRMCRRFKGAVKRAGVREIRFHDLRHTFGTRMAGAGVPMRTLQEWMGHSDLTTTLRYADYSPDQAGGARYAEAAFGAGTNSGTKLSATEDNSDPLKRLG